MIMIAPPPVFIASSSDRFAIVATISDRYVEAPTLAQDGSHWTHLHRLILDIQICAPQPFVRVDRHTLGLSARDELENGLAVQLTAGADTASAEHTAVVVQQDLLVGGIHLTPWELVGVAHAIDPQAIGDCLQFTTATLLTAWAEMIAFGEEHLDDRTSKVAQLAAIDLHFVPVHGRLGAGRHGPTIHLHHAHAAGAMRAQLGVTTEMGNVDLVFASHFHDGLPRASLQSLSVDTQDDGLRHGSSSL